LDEKVEASDLIGLWYLTLDGAAGLRAEYRLNMEADRDYFIELKPFGTGHFRTFNTSRRDFEDAALNWSLEHDVRIASGEHVANVVRIIISLDGKKKEMEVYFVARFRREGVLWQFWNNGFGDEFVLAYHRDRK
jgi:hypothetical protein